MSADGQNASPEFAIGFRFHRFHLPSRTRSSPLRRKTCPCPAVPGCRSRNTARSAGTRAEGTRAGGRRRSRRPGGSGRRRCRRPGGSGRRRRSRRSRATPRWPSGPEEEAEVRVSSLVFVGRGRRWHLRTRAVGPVITGRGLASPGPGRIDGTVVSETPKCALIIIIKTTQKQYK